MYGMTDVERAERARDDADRAERHNRELFATMAQGREERGFVAVVARGATIHGAASVTHGHNGFVFPRPFCMGHTATTFADLASEPLTREVTCKRCVASIAKRSL